MKKTVRDMALNVIFILIGIVLALLVPSQVKGLNQAAQMGPDFFPYIAAGLMVTVNAIALAANYARYAKEKRAGREETAAQSNPKDQLRVIFILAIIAGYVFLMPVLGYVVSTLLVVNGLLFMLNVRKWYQYLLVSGFAMVIYYVFKYILYVMLP